MKRRIFAGIGFILVAASCALAQKTVLAPKIDGLVLDGALTEDFWTSPSVQREELRHDKESMLVSGSVDGYSDHSQDFVLVWDDQGLTCGTWKTDDIHYTYWGTQPGVANKAWMDDAVEWYVSSDFNDVWEDASSLYFGQFGFQVWKGLCWENGAFVEGFTSYRNDEGPTIKTETEMTELGFTAPYTSLDGINFTCEAHFKWSSFLLGSMTSPSAGKEVGFNLAAIDSDGSQTGDAALYWGGGGAHQYQTWGKVTLGDAVNIRAVRMMARNTSKYETAGVYDILGRRLGAEKQLSRNGLTFSRIRGSHGEQAVKRIRLR